MSNDWKRAITEPPTWAKDDVKGMYLFGSRSMAVRDEYKRFSGEDFDVKTLIADRITQKTDYDYAAQHSYVLRDRLEERGWTEVNVTSLYAPDPMLKSLYIKTDGETSVQILLRKNHVLFETAWESIDPAFWYRFIWKSSPDFVFKGLDKPVYKDRINAIIQQIYNDVNRIYKWR